MRSRVLRQASNVGSAAEGAWVSFVGGRGSRFSSSAAEGYVSEGLRLALQAVTDKGHKGPRVVSHALLDTPFILPPDALAGADTIIDGKQKVYRLPLYGSGREPLGLHYVKQYMLKPLVQIQAVQEAEKKVEDTVGHIRASLKGEDDIAVLGPAEAAARYLAELGLKTDMMDRVQAVYTDFVDLLKQAQHHTISETKIEDFCCKVAGDLKEVGERYVEVVTPALMIREKDPTMRCFLAQKEYFVLKLLNKMGDFKVKTLPGVITGEDGTKEYVLITEDLKPMAHGNLFRRPKGPQGLDALAATLPEEQMRQRSHVMDFMFGVDSKGITTAYVDANTYRHLAPEDMQQRNAHLVSEDSLHNVSSVIVRIANRIWTKWFNSTVQNADPNRGNVMLLPEQVALGDYMAHWMLSIDQDTSLPTGYQLREPWMQEDTRVTEHGHLVASTIARNHLRELQGLRAVYGDERMDFDSALGLGLGKHLAILGRTKARSHAIDSIANISTSTIVKCALESFGYYPDPEMRQHVRGAIEQLLRNKTIPDVVQELVENNQTEISKEDFCARQDKSVAEGLAEFDAQWLAAAAEQHAGFVSDAKRLAEAAKQSAGNGSGRSA